MLDIKRDAKRGPYVAAEIQELQALQQANRKYTLGLKARKMLVSASIAPPRSPMNPMPSDSRAQLCVQ